MGEKYEGTLKNRWGKCVFGLRRTQKHYESISV